LTTLPPQGERRMDNTPVGRLMFRLATAVAIAGGLSLVLVTVVTMVSVIGRALIPIGLKPVPGDYEIVQSGVMFAIFSSLPLTQYLRGHADVAVLTDLFPTRLTAVIEFIMDILMLAATVFILWRFGAGLVDKYNNREMTLILHMPIWWAYAAGMLGAICTVIVSLYCVARSGVNATSRHPHKPEPGLF
jgi:TRAP-type C4-dicarboxylate transport system permease small subunit